MNQKTKFIIEIREGKEAHFKMAVSSFDPEYTLTQKPNNKGYILETTMSMIDVESLTSVSSVRCDDSYKLRLSALLDLKKQENLTGSELIKIKNVYGKLINGCIMEFSGPPAKLIVTDSLYEHKLGDLSSLINFYGHHGDAPFVFPSNKLVNKVYTQVEKGTAPGMYGSYVAVEQTVVVFEEGDMN